MPRFRLRQVLTDRSPPVTSQPPRLERGGIGWCRASYVSPGLVNLRASIPSSAGCPQTAEILLHQIALCHRAGYSYGNSEARRDWRPPIRKSFVLRVEIEIQVHNCN